jgi:hypothetical protein
MQTKFQKFEFLIFFKSNFYHFIKPESWFLGIFTWLSLRPLNIRTIKALFWKYYSNNLVRPCSIENVYTYRMSIYQYDISVSISVRYISTLKGVVHAGKAFSKAHNFLFLYSNLIKISGIVVRNLWNTFYCWLFS